MHRNSSQSPRSSLDPEPRRDLAFEARRIDLHPFILYRDRNSVLPEALSAGFYVVNSAQDSGRKDSWIILAAKRDEGCGGGAL